MEQSLSSLAFKGSILEAIAEAKRQKKLFVVYIAGDNSDSKQLETSTWIDPKVSDTLAKYCILLHILEGSSEASNFSAIYPQNSAPCITAVGYNGVQLWQKEGFIAADALASSIEKAWLSLHLQESTAAFLSAALASGKQIASETASSGQEAPAPGAYAPSLADDHAASHSGQPSTSEPIEEKNMHEDVPKETDSQRDNEAFPKPSHVNVLDTGALGESTSKSETGIKLQDPDEIGQTEVARPVLGTKSNSLDDNLGEVSQRNGKEPSEVAHITADETTEVEKADASYSSATKSDDVFLNIRLPDGSSIQVKFHVIDTLKMVKDYVNDNQTSSIGSFSLAIPYPRRVFNDEDLVSTLSELGFFYRQALVVVPCGKTNSHYGGSSSSVQHQTYASNDDLSSDRSEGYWASLKRILSYFNPLSYVGGAGSPSATQESQSGPWQYGPNSSPGSLGGSLPAHPSSQNMPASGRNSNSSNRGRQQTRFGGNIHTLKHDEDDSRFNDRNAFWNGNSTQFGGDNDGK